MFVKSEAEVVSNVLFGNLNNVQQKEKGPGSRYAKKLSPRPKGSSFAFVTYFGSYFGCFSTPVTVCW